MPITRRDVLLSAAAAALSTDGAASADPRTIYSFTVAGRKGETVDLSAYRGKVLLVVNTATECGFTPQYGWLQDLYEELRGKGFEILDFPCNQFGGQAPGTAEEIHTICTGRFGVTFPQFGKIDVNGPKADPLFAWLTANTRFQGFKPGHRITPILEKMLRAKDPDYDKTSSIKWNFTKFLIDREGHIAGRFESTGEAPEVREAILKLL